ncbi:MAG: molybdopterin-dependent oxidoreductase, partial [candidate division NC10 bacterium]|nr:molybdopterin-dependent oxidoreductase [candidate division NC10 bacterium]
EQLFALIPLDLFSLGIRLFGLKAKYLAFWGMVGLFVLIGLFLGVVFTWLAKRHWLKAHWRGGLAYGSLLWALFGLVGSPLLGGGLFGANLEGGLLLSSSSLLLLYWVYGATLGLLSSRLLRHSRNTLTTTGSSPPPLDASRRAFATRLLTGILAAGSFSALLQLLDTLTTRSRAFAQDLFQRLKGLPPELTPNEKFYKISKNVFDPKVNVSRWSLKLKGLVERPMQLTYSELKALPMKEQYGTLECISNEVGGALVSNARWKGIPLGELLARAGVKSSAKKVVFHSADGYSTAIPLMKAMHPDTLLAVEMNGVPLPDDHGFPVRLINPGHYGMKNPKWITEIELTETDYKGYWESRGWSDEARVKTMSRIDTPAHGSKVSAHEAETGGTAFAGDRGIRQVEVSFDDGRTWRKAMLKPTLGSYTWVLWGLAWEPSASADAGARHGSSLTLKVRATDGSGNIQTAHITNVLPDGASGYHTIHVTLS